MKLRVLGVHNMESRATRLAAHLVDDVLALDAGGLTRSLDFADQSRIRAIIVTHRHFDHVRDLLPLGLAVRESGVTVDVFGIRDTLDYLKDKLFDGSLYPDFLSQPSVETPVFRLCEVPFYEEFQVLDYTVMAVPVPHSVPAAGYQIGDGSTRMFYTGDTGKDIAGEWRHVSPDVLLTEVTFGNDGEAMAVAAGHLTPRHLEQALECFRQRHGYLPRVIVGHINPPWEDAVRREVQAVAGRLGIEILVPRADTVLDLP
jgi:ribonuclease BN (tRNA processing enzyme)